VCVVERSKSLKKISPVVPIDPGVFNPTAKFVTVVMYLKRRSVRETENTKDVRTEHTVEKCR
jgi:hypothetical protein